MITRLVRRKRPRRSAFLVIGATVVLAVGILAALAIATTQSDTGTGSPNFSGNCDVTVASNTTSADCQLGAAGGFVSYIGSNDTAKQASGTGLFDPFVRLQNTPTEQGFNTDAPVTFDAKTGTWTHAIKVNAIPIVACDRFTGDTARCWELFVDINDSNTAKRISLNDVQIFFTNSAVLSGYASGPPPTFSSPSGNATSLEYTFHGNILINDVNSGSGRGDLRYRVPTAGHTWDSTTWFVLYSKWGGTSPTTTALNGTGGWGSDGGFEEWKVKKTPNVSIVKTANPPGPVSAGSTIGFDISLSNTGVAAATNVIITDSLPVGAGNDLLWSLNPAFPGCSISPALTRPQTLTCTFSTVAAGATIGPIHIQSGTTAADCATVTNTANFASDNAGTGSSTASVDVQCGALKILKQSTKSGNPLVANAGAVFSVDGPDANTTPDFSVTDDTTAAAPDEDADVGEVCVSGLAPGTYTVNETSPPTGYGNAGQSNVAVTVANGTNCTTSLPGTAATATFTNPPLGEIGVTFTDLGSGETNSSIVCTTGTTTVPAVSENGQQDASFAITSNSAANPTVVTLATALSPVPSSGAKLRVKVAGVTGSDPTINGTWTATVIDSTHVSLPVNEATGGTGGTMTVYDDTDEAFTALPPGTYNCQVVIDP